jgi:hypothetical protein
LVERGKIGARGKRGFGFGAGGLQLLFEFGHGAAQTVTKPAPSRKKRFGRRQHLLDGDEFHAFHVDAVRAMPLKAGRTRDTGAQDDVAVAVRAGQGGIGRAEDRDNGRADSGGNVHRAAVVGDDDGAAAIEFRKLKEVGFPGLIRIPLGDLFDRGAIRSVLKPVSTTRSRGSCSDSARQTDRCPRVSFPSERTDSRQ